MSTVTSSAPGSQRAAAGATGSYRLNQNSLPAAVCVEHVCLTRAARLMMALLLCVCCAV
jgi:hypothetical protein